MCLCLDIKNTLYNNPQVKEEIKIEMRNYFELNDIKITTYQHVGFSESSNQTFMPYTKYVEK